MGTPPLRHTSPSRLAMVHWCEDVSRLEALRACAQLRSSFTLAPHFAAWSASAAAPSPHQLSQRHSSCSRHPIPSPCCLEARPHALRPCECIQIRRAERRAAMEEMEGPEFWQDIEHHMAPSQGTALQRAVTLHGEGELDNEVAEAQHAVALALLQGAEARATSLTHRLQAEVLASEAARASARVVRRHVLKRLVPRDLDMAATASHFHDVHEALDGARTGTIQALIAGVEEDVKMRKRTLTEAQDAVDALKTASTQSLEDGDAQRHLAEALVGARARRDDEFQTLARVITLREALMARLREVSPRAQGAIGVVAQWLARLGHCGGGGGNQELLEAHEVAWAAVNEATARGAQCQLEREAVLVEQFEARERLHGWQQAATVVWV